MPLNQIVNANVTPEKLAIVFKSAFILLFLMVLYFSREKNTKEIKNPEKGV